MSIVRTLKPIEDATIYDSWKAQWKEQSELDYFSYIRDQCNPEDALLLGKLFFPDFVQVDDFVFLEMVFSEQAFNSCIAKHGGDFKAVESAMNNILIYDVFSGSTGVTDSVFEQVAKMLCFSWGLVLKYKFPERKFYVETLISELNYGPIVTFHQV